tara:strand:+ start:7516 stop:8016 length:501 start_codon:yes stop_codon:yes gene_type:complete
MIGEEIIQKAGKKRRSGDWYINELEAALLPLQNRDISTSDTDFIEVGRLFFFSYGAAYPENYEFWDLQPLSFALRFYKDGFLGANLHYINPDYRDAVAISLLNSGSAGSTTVPKNSLHKYLYSGIGNLYQVPRTEDWDVISKLPTEKFIARNGMKYPKHKAFNWRK